MPEKTLTIPTYRIATLEKEVRNLARHAQRLGLDAPTLMVLQPTKREELQHSRTILRDESDRQELDGQPVVVEVVDVVLTTPNMGLASGKYQTVAALQHLGNEEDGKRMVEVFAPNVENAKRVEPFRTETFCCQHCNTTRRRIWSIIVEEVATGKVLQLGKECADSYVADPEAEIKRLQFEDLVTNVINVSVDSFDGDGYYVGAGRGLRTADSIDVAAHSIALVRQHGWNKRYHELGIGESRRTESLTSTGLNVAMSLGLRTKKEVSTDFVPKKYEVTDDDRKQAELALSWIATVGEDNEFLAGLKMAFLQTWISEKKVYLASSLSIAWEKELERRRIEARGPGKHLGSLKERKVFEVFVSNMHSWNTDFGLKTAYTMEDRDGNTLVWKTTGDGFPNGYDAPNNRYISRSKDHWFKIKGTVKAHNEYRGVNQTELTRVAIERDYQKEVVDAEKAKITDEAKRIAGLPEAECLEGLRSVVDEAVIHVLWPEIRYDDARRRALASNPHLPESIMQAMVFSMGLCRLELAQNPSTPGRLLDTIAFNDEDKVASAMALRHLNCPQDTLLRECRRLKVGQIAEVLKNPKVRAGDFPSVLSNLLESHGPEVKQEVRQILLSIDVSKKLEAAEQDAVSGKSMAYILVLQQRVQFQPAALSADQLSAQLEGRIHRSRSIEIS